MNKLLAIFLILFSVFSIRVSADNNSYIQTQKNLEQYDEIRYQDTKDVFDNLTNRLILSMMGKDILLFFLPADTPENIISEIKNFNEDDISFYSRPFNKNASDLMWVVLFAINIVALIVAIIYFSWIFLERLIVTSESSDFLGKNVDKGKVNIKYIIIFLLIAPIVNFPSSNSEKYGYLSIIQLAAIKFVGVASYTGDKIFEIYANNTPSYYPSIRIPRPDAKSLEMLEIIKYMSCVHTDQNYNKESVDFNFIKKSDKLFVAESGTDLCNLKINISFDNKTLSILKNELLKNKYINVDFDYNQKQYNEFRESFQDILDKASLIGSKISNSKLNVDYSNINYNISKDGWYNTCDDYYKNIESINIENNEILDIFIYKGINCLSYDYINNFVKVPDVNNIYNYLDSNNYLNREGYNIELCTHDFTKDKKIKTEISDSYGVLNKKELEENLNWKSLNIEECVQKNCNDFNSSSMYQCAASIGLAKEHFDRNDAAKKGWLTSGAYIYKLLSNVKATDNAKVLVNSLNIKFNYNDNSLVNPNLLTINTINNNIGGINKELNLSHNIKNKNFNNFENIQELNNQLTGKIKKIIDDKYGEKITAKSVLEKTLGEKFLRLKKCLQKPLTTTDGYSCENVTSELNKLGQSLITIATSFKIGVFATELRRSTYGPDGKIKNGGNSGETLKNELTKKIKTSSFLKLFLLVGSFDVNEIINFILDGSQEDVFMTDAGATDLLILTGSASMFAATSAIDSEGFIDFVNTIIWYMFFVGIFLGFVIPLIPFGLWVMAVLGWLIQFFQLMVNLPIWAATLLGVTEEDNAMAIKVGIKMIISMILRIPLMIIGLIIAWLLTNVFVQQVLSVELIGMSLNYGDSNIVIQFFDYLLVLLIYVIMMLIVYNMMFSLIEGFHELAMNWMGDQGSEKLMGKQGQETQMVVGKYRQYSQRFKRLKWNLKKV